MTGHCQRYSAKPDQNEHRLCRGTVGSEARGTRVASQRPWSGPRTGFSKRMTDSNDSTRRGVEKHRRMLTAQERSTVTNGTQERRGRKRMSEPGKENVRASWKVFIGNSYLPLERDVAAVVALPRSALPGTTTLERHTPTQVPARAASRRVESTRTSAVLACSKSGVQKGHDNEGKVAGCKGYWGSTIQ